MPPMMSQIRMPPSGLKDYSGLSLFNLAPRSRLGTFLWHWNPNVEQGVVAGDLSKREEVVCGALFISARVPAPSGLWLRGLSGLMARGTARGSSPHRNCSIIGAAHSVSCQYW